MKVLICFKHLKSTPMLEKLDEKIHLKSQKLAELMPQALEAKWTCWTANGRYFVEVFVCAPNLQVSARASGHTLYRGVERVVEKMEKQVLKHKGSSKRPLRRKGNIIFLEAAEGEASAVEDMLKDQDSEAAS